MKCSYWYLLVLMFFSGMSITEATHTSIRFYGESIAVDYHPSVVLDTRLQCTDEAITNFYQQLEHTDYQGLLQTLQAHRYNLQLNDWLYYELLHESVQKILYRKTSLQQTLTTWFLLSKSGYDTRLTYLHNEAFLYVYTKDNLFEVPMIEEHGRTFINLSSLEKTDRHYATEVFMLHFVANKGGRPFSFYMESLPKLQPQLKERTYQFAWRDEVFKLHATIDLTVISLMKNYPVIDETQYLEIPMSSAVAQSIIPQLKKIIAERPEKEALEILVAFTRSAFEYKEDHAHFGKSKPMIADEVFYYPYSDCEDRSALFYNLVKALLDLPMIMIAYPDHLTIGVALSQPVGKPIRYRGKKYYVCDPTGPRNSFEIGRIPKDYQHQSFEILASYK